MLLRSLMFPALCLLAVPFITLLLVTPWHHFALAYGDARAVWTSLSLSLLSLPLIVILGTPVSLWLANTRSSWRFGIEIGLLIPLLTPPLAMGILLVAAYGPYGTLGEIIARLGVNLTNTPAAFILAQLYAALPFYVLMARNAFEAVPTAVTEVAETLGANRWQLFWRLSLPLARRGLLNSLSLAWARALGEFGIVMIFCYFPQGIPVKLYVNLQNGGVEAVYTLLWILLLTSLPLPLWCFYRSRKP
ncbi:molybdate/tungstate transport system permease protein [Rosenbergiella nectarea]|uniref:Molybdate/tungstate transport system permease protein n=1 Tax=Rosenbergiella nectarea TaxID=988801 RepID=A0A1H9GLE0_9GAMM|nr:ABC transporter permease subunit [Rosenbergiella nectarea]SEQ50916.1 molybdate/tungstate transport system permease protein [Rosenbergiella nectarea]